MSVLDKLKILAKERGRPLDVGRPPGQWFAQALDARHAVMHAKPGPVSIPLAGKRSPSPGATDSLAARRACCGTRAVLVDLARNLGVDPPRYLAYAPLDPDDVAAWRSAIVMTGAREDPDFPPLRTRNEV